MKRRVSSVFLCHFRKAITLERLISPGVALIFGVSELQVPFVDQSHPESSSARGVDAVVHVGAEGGAEDNVEGVADAHDVAWLPRWQGFTIASYEWERDGGCGEL